jgi:LAS superfamily LD-carboxypeptidase LdcB
MKNLIVFIAIVFAMVSVFAQESVYPLNPSSMITVQECIDLMAAAQTKVEKTTELKKQVEKTVAAVKKGKKTPEAGAKEIAQKVADAPKEVPVETKKAANNVARKVLYQEDLKDAMQAFEGIVNADIAKFNEEIDSL